MRKHTSARKLLGSLISGVVIASSGVAFASSHREAPLISSLPKLDGTDLYMFRSYEADREDFVTILANYLPVQAPYGGPNYFDLETAGFYEIHIDNDGDSLEDVTFRFKFNTLLAGVTVPVGGQDVAIPLVIAGGVGPGAEDTGNVNSRQEYTIDYIVGDRDSGSSSSVLHADTQASSFRKPLDNIGTKSIPNYTDYANDHIWPISIPGCETEGRVFVGQRKESFSVNLGAVFDLVNLNPLGPVNAVPNELRDVNITTLALELPIACLADDDPVIGAWTTSSLDLSSINGSAQQVSRLGFPLINELVIGLPDKDRFNASEPSQDGQFVQYVANPTLPFLLELLFSDAGAVAPTNFPRMDLFQAIGGVPGLNLPAKQADGTFSSSEMLRLNTSIGPLLPFRQMNLGVLAGDTSGFPNGRRPGDDVVDIILRVMMGALNSDSTVAPNNTAPFTDQTTLNANQFKTAFPYLNDPLPGATSP